MTVFDFPLKGYNFCFASNADAEPFLVADTELCPRKNLENGYIILIKGEQIDNEMVLPLFDEVRQGMQGIVKGIYSNKVEVEEFTFEALIKRNLSCLGRECNFVQLVPILYPAKNPIC